MIVPMIWTTFPKIIQIRRPTRSLHGEATMQQPNHDARRNDATTMESVVVFEDYVSF